MSQRPSGTPDSDRARRVRAARRRRRRTRGGVAAPHRTVYSASIIKSIFVTAFVNRRSVRDRPLRRWERQLLRPMIVRSDDGAATTVRDLLGTPGSSPWRAGPG